MLPIEVVQEALISLMKSRPVLVAALGPIGSTGPEIREDNWMSRNFKYPALRVRLLTMGPRSVDNGECMTMISDIFFTVMCYAEGDSSLACAKLMSTTIKQIQGLRISTVQIVPMSRIYVPPGGMIAPVVEADRIWRGEVQFRTILKEAS